MKKYIKYLFSTVITFIIMIILEYLFEGNIDIKSNLCYAVVFFVIQILMDKIFSRKDN